MHNHSIIIHSILKTHLLKRATEVSDGRKCVEDILASFKKIIELQRELLDITDEAGDEGTNSLMSDYITEQEKKYGCTALSLENKPILYHIIYRTKQPLDFKEAAFYFYNLSSIFLILA